MNIILFVKISASSLVAASVIWGSVAISQNIKSQKDPYTTNLEINKIEINQKYKVGGFFSVSNLALEELKQKFQCQVGDLATVSCNVSSIDTSSSATHEAASEPSQSIVDPDQSNKTLIDINQAQFTSLDSTFGAQSKDSIPNSNMALSPDRYYKIEIYQDDLSKWDNEWSTKPVKVYKNNIGIVNINADFETFSSDVIFNSFIGKASENTSFYNQDSCSWDYFGRHAKDCKIFPLESYGSIKDKISEEAKTQQQMKDATCTIPELVKSSSKTRTQKIQKKYENYCEAAAKEIKKDHYYLIWFTSPGDDNGSQKTSYLMTHTSPPKIYLKDYFSASSNIKVNFSNLEGVLSIQQKK